MIPVNMKVVLVNPRARKPVLSARDTLRRKRRRGRFLNWFHNWFLSDRERRLVPRWQGGTRLRNWRWGRSLFSIPLRPRAAWLGG